MLTSQKSENTRGLRLYEQITHASHHARMRIMHIAENVISLKGWSYINYGQLHCQECSLLLPLSVQASPWFWFYTWTSSVARLHLALFLVAFTRATIVVLCRGENGNPFCLPELSPCTNCMHLHRVHWSFRFIEISPALPSMCCFQKYRKKFYFGSTHFIEKSLLLHGRPNILVGNLWQLITASNGGVRT